MIEPGEQPAFFELALGIVMEGITTSHFDGDPAIELLVMSEIDTAKGALPELSLNAVAAETIGRLKHARERCRITGKFV